MVRRSRDRPPRHSANAAQVEAVIGLRSQFGPSLVRSGVIHTTNTDFPNEGAG